MTARIDKRSYLSELGCGHCRRMALRLAANLAAQAEGYPSAAGRAS